MKPENTPLERDIQKAIVDALKREHGVRVERNNRGSRRHIRFGLGDGAADLVGLVEIPHSGPGPCRAYRPIGRFFALEIKRPGEEMEPHQLKWAEEVRAMGGYVGCAHSVSEALAHVKAAKDVR